MTDAIIKKIEEISGKYSPYEVFCDWVQMMAIAISNQVEISRSIWEVREEQYKAIYGKYGKEDIRQMFWMTALLIDALEADIADVLGDVYMRSGMGSKITGQFFTPFHISVMTARIGIGEQIEEIKRGKRKKLDMQEPSCGGGGMIIATAKILKEEGINYQKVMRVVAQDLDWKGVYMCYVQLALLGINATCVQGDSLKKPFRLKEIDPTHVLVTPGRLLEAAC